MGFANFPLQQMSPHNPYYLCRVAEIIGIGPVGTQRLHNNHGIATVGKLHHCLMTVQRLGGCPHCPVAWLNGALGYYSGSRTAMGVLYRLQSYQSHATKSDLIGPLIFCCIVWSIS